MNQQTNNDTNHTSRIKKLNFEFCAVPVSILKRSDLTAGEKLLYSVLLGYQSNGDCWASNEHLCEILGCCVSTIKRGLEELERKNCIRRNTQQINKFKKERTITALILGTNTEGQNEPSGGSKRTSLQGQNEPRTEGQNEPLLDNSLLNNSMREGKHTHAHKSFRYISLTSEETNLGSGRFLLATFPYLALTYPEAAEIDKRLATVNFGDINAILLSANAMGESSESKKHKSKSFNYINLAINDYTSGKVGAQKATVTQLPANKIVKAKREKVSPEARNLGMNLVSELTKKLSQK